MAISKEKWLEVQGFYEAGLSLAEIKDRTGVDRSTISKKAKNQQWQHRKNADYIEARELIVEKKSTENQHLLNCADVIAEENIRNRNLVFGASAIVLKKVTDLATKGKAQKVVTIGQGMGMSSPEIVEHDLQAKDYKDIQDTIDKASITLGVNERFSTAKVEVNNQNNNIIEVEIE